AADGRRRVGVGVPDGLRFRRTTRARRRVVAVRPGVFDVGDHCRDREARATLGPTWRRRLTAPCREPALRFPPIGWPSAATPGPHRQTNWPPFMVRHRAYAVRLTYVVRYAVSAR